MKKLKKYCFTFLNEIFLRYQLRRLLHWKVFDKSIIRLGKYKIEFLEPLSLHSEFIYIFKKKIYNFESDKISPLIIDVGSYIGISLLLFKDIYPSSRIIAFEPDPNVFSILQRNVKNNSLQNIELINSAIGDKTGFINLV